MRLLTYLSLISTRYSLYAWYISPPRAKSEWEGLSRLLVNSFEQPQEGSSVLEKIQWNLFGRTSLERSTYQRYVKTGRRMRGTKYSILVAKDKGAVIGMVELGLNDRASSTRLPTIGLICVLHGYRGKRIGEALVQRCVEIASRDWMEDRLVADVAEDNENAQNFFTSIGFRSDGEREMVQTKVGRETVVKPHIVFYLPLDNRTITD